MACYVDPMIDWGKRIGAAGPSWCHLIGDTPAELHEVAAGAGLLRRWYQSPPRHGLPHYDIGTARVRTAALRAGAVECDKRTFVGHMRRIRAAVAADPAAWTDHDCHEATDEEPGTDEA